jgi:hypothetical protein
MARKKKLEDVLQGSVVDPDSFHPDSDIKPDQALLGESGSGYGSSVLMTKYIYKKNTAEIFFFSFFDQKL